MALRRPRDRAAAAALAGYALVGFVYVWARLLPHPGRWYVGEPTDPQIFIWSFAWWPHAIAHGLNPFYTHFLWSPPGYSIAWTTTTPLLAIALAPVTWLFGPVVSYDVAEWLMPVLAAWTAFLLCRHVTRRVWPSLVGGYLFGFSSYMIGQLDAHLHMTSVFLMPLVALVILRYVEGGLDGIGAALRLGPLFAAQLWLSFELTFTLALAIVVALVVAFALVPVRRHRIVSLAGPLLASCGVAAVLAAPLAYYALKGFTSGSILQPQAFPTDLANIAVPTARFVAGGRWSADLASHFAGTDTERDAYLGVPVLLIVGWLALRRRRERGTWFLLACALVAIVCSFGQWLVVDGHRIVTMPWEHVSYLPLFDNVLPGRLMLYAWLPVAVMAAIWTASARGLVAIALPLLAVAALVPDLSSGFWRTRVDVPAFFRGDGVRRCLAPGENVLVLPQAKHGNAMLQQAVGGFRFTMADGYLSPDIPSSFLGDPAVARVANRLVTWRDLAVFARVKHVDAILVEADQVGDWRSVLRPLAPGQEVGGVYVYRLAGDGCAPPGGTKRVAGIEPA